MSSYVCNKLFALCQNDTKCKTQMNWKEPKKAVDLQVDILAN